MDAETKKAWKRAKKTFNELRKSVDGFQRARVQTDKATLGLIGNKLGMSPAQVADHVKRVRDYPRMKEAVEKTNDLLSQVYQRQPSVEELTAGPPDGSALGNFQFPAVPWSVTFLVGIAASAWALTSIFNYLRSHEERIQTALGVPQDGERSSVVPLTILSLAAAGGLAGFLLWRRHQSAARAADVESATTRVLPSKSGRATTIYVQNEEEDVEEAEEEDDNATD